jgi:hypothetical protein
MKVGKRITFLLLIVIPIIILAIKIWSSFIFYKKAFNATIYDNLVRTQLYSQSVWYSADELISGKNVTVENLINLKWNYDETLQSLQRLNSNSIRVAQKKEVNLNKYTHLSGQLANIKKKYSGQTQKLNLTGEEISILTETKEIFKTLAEIISENLNDVSYLDSWGGKDVLREDDWLNIIEDIQMKQDEFHK